VTKITTNGSKNSTRGTQSYICHTCNTTEQIPSSA